MDFTPLGLMFMSLLFNVLVILPLSNTLVRWRAHYCPSRVRLQNRSGERQPPVENEGVIAPAFGYFKIFTRIYKVEGLTGYYKGLGPHILSFVVHMLVMAIFNPATRNLFMESESTERDSNQENIFDRETPFTRRLSYSIAQLVVDIPIQIISNRTIITSYRLPWHSPTKAIRILLSPSERRSPWKLYLLPGYLMSRAIMLAFSFGVNPISDVLLPDQVRNAPPDQASGGLSKAFIPSLLFSILSALVGTPLQVTNVRLSLQRYSESEAVDGDDNSGRGRTEEQVPGVQRYSNEDVIVLKDTTRFPYTGLFDCLNAIINEEGWRTLMKSGWLTFLGI